MRRRLATILAGDVVGSTAAMEADEEAAVTRFAAALDAVADVVAKREGRVFHTAGDALFAEFVSPVNALHAAMEARSALVGVEGVTPSDMRFGLHLADVVEVGDDLRGDGVNLAARIQANAPAGEIHVSAALFEQVRRGSPCTFEDLGEVALKGVSEGIRLYRVAGQMERFPFQSAPSRAADLALRPHSVAVAPFRAGGAADDDQRYLAEGLTEDLIRELAHGRRLFVSSRSASFALDSEDPAVIGRRLGVRYVVAGSVRRMGPRLRLGVSLSDTRSGRTVWSDRIDKPWEEIWDAMDALTARIAATVFGRIEHEDISAARRSAPASLDAYEAYLRGIEQHRLGRLTDAHVREAMDWFGRAMEADPDFAAPVAMQICAASQLTDFDWEWGVRQIEKALALDPHDPEVNRVMGSIKMKEGDFAAARLYHDRAMEMAPSDAYIIARCAAFHVYAGEPETALDLVRRAEELDPFLPVWCSEEKVAALYALDRFEDALAAARALPYQTRRSRLYRAACRVALGDVERARRLVAEALAENPGLALDFVESNENFESAATLKLLAGRLREAGLPDPTPNVAGRLEGLRPSRIVETG